MEILQSLRSLIQAPPTPVDPIYANVTPYKANVTLYKDTPLVDLRTNATVKMLKRGKQLELAGKYRATHYITTYSYTRKIPNGFAISATIKPVEDCTAYKNEIARLKTEKAALTAQLASLKVQVNTLTTQLVLCRKARAVAEAIVKKLKDAHKAIS